MQVTLSLGPFVQAQAAKLQAKLDSVAALAAGLQQVAVSLQSFNPDLNKNFPKQDEIIAQFDQTLTARVVEYKTGMLELRARLPQPKPPITPVCAVWPGVPGGSIGV